MSYFITLHDGNLHIEIKCDPRAALTQIILHRHRLLIASLCLLSWQITPLIINTSCSSWHFPAHLRILRNSLASILLRVRVISDCSPLLSLVLWSCDFEWRPLIGRNFLMADLAYLSNSKTILPLVKFWSGHYFKKNSQKNWLPFKCLQFFFLFSWR